MALALVGVFVAFLTGVLRADVFFAAAFTPVLGGVLPEVADLGLPFFGPFWRAWAATSLSAAAAMFWNCSVKEPHHCIGSTAGLAAALASGADAASPVSGACADGAGVGSGV